MECYVDACCAARNVVTRDTPCACRARTTGVEAVPPPERPSPFVRNNVSFLSRHPRARPHAPRGRYYGPKHGLSLRPSALSLSPSRATDSGEVWRDASLRAERGRKRRRREKREKERAVARLARRSGSGSRHSGGRRLVRRVGGSARARGGRAHGPREGAVPPCRPPAVRATRYH